MIRLLGLTLFIHLLIQGVLYEIVSVLVSETVLYEIEDQWEALKDSARNLFK